MAVTIGTNSGFVSSAPSADPAGSAVGFTGDVYATKDTSPSGSNNVTQLGWYQARGAGVPSKEYQMALYSHDAGNDRPNAVVGSAQTGSTSNADTAEWLTYGSLSIAISASTIYWVGYWIPGGGNNSNTDEGSSGSFKRDSINDIAGIPDPSWGVSDGTTTRAMAAYALYAAAGGSSVPMFWHHLNKNIGR